jgi:hypothetical protein
MDNYQFYLPVRVLFLSPPNRTGEVLHFLGASIDPGDGDLDGCTLVMVILMIMPPFLSKLAWSMDLF